MLEATEASTLEKKHQAIKYALTGARVTVYYVSFQRCMVRA